MSRYRIAKQRPRPKAALPGTGSKIRVAVDPTLTSIMMIPGPMIDNGTGPADASLWHQHSFSVFGIESLEPRRFLSAGTPAAAPQWLSVVRGGSKSII